MKCFLVTFLLSVSIVTVICFSPPSFEKRSLVRIPSWLCLTSAWKQEEKDLEAKVRSMRVNEIKQELNVLGIDYKDIFEKEELVQRLLKSWKENRKDDPVTVLDRNNSMKECRVRLDFHSLSPQQAVEAKNNVNIFLRPSPGKFPSIRIHLPSHAGALNLLVDTACSGVVLRPQIVKKFNLPTFNVGSTMQAAGGLTTGGLVSKIMGPKLDDGTVLEDMMVAGQHIGALPVSLDGIIGISFLQQFQYIAFDFQSGELILKKKQQTAIKNDIQMEVLAECKCTLSRLGIWTLDVTLDGRGPVKMLLDTGAASTFLNWKGANDCNLNPDHPLVSRNRDPIGAMGADNKAFQLSHRIQIKRRINFKNPSVIEAFGPMGIDLIEHGHLDIDIGDLPVLESLKSENVGGILGSDLLMRCDVLELVFSRDKNDSAPTIRMLKRVLPL